MRTLALLFCLTAAASAAVDTLIPVSVGTYDQWFCTEPSKVTAVVPPDDATVIQGTAAESSQSYFLSTPDIPVGSTIDWVAVSVRLHGAASSGQSFLRLGTSEVHSPSHFLYYGEGYVTFVDTIALELTLGDLDNLQVGVYAVDGGAYAENCMTLFVMVGYTAGEPPPAPSDDNGFWGWLGD